MADNDTPEIWTCDCGGYRVTFGPVHGQRMDEKNLACTECGDEEIVKADKL